MLVVGDVNLTQFDVRRGAGLVQEPFGLAGCTAAHILKVFVARADRHQQRYGVGARYDQPPPSGVNLPAFGLDARQRLEVDRAYDAVRTAADALQGQRVSAGRGHFGLLWAVEGGGEGDLARLVR